MPWIGAKDRDILLVAPRREVYKMGTPDQPSSRMCVQCGKSIAMDANVCPYCGHDFRAQAAPPVKKTVIPVVGGVMIFLAGIMGLAMGGILIAIDVDQLSDYGVDVAGITDMLEDILTVCGAIWMIIGLIAVLGGIFGLLRKHWGLAILGGVMGLFVIGPWALGSLFALVGLILVAVSKKEFE